MPGARWRSCRAGLARGPPPRGARYRFHQAGSPREVRFSNRSETVPTTIAKLSFSAVCRFLRFGRQLLQHIYEVIEALLSNLFGPLFMQLPKTSENGCDYFMSP